MSFRFRKRVRLFKGAEFSPTLARIDEAVWACCGAKAFGPADRRGDEFFSPITV